MVEEEIPEAGSVMCVQRHLRDAEDEAQHVGSRHEHVLLQRAVREPDHGAEHQEEGERDGHELHALGPDHLPLQAVQVGSECHD